jgi:5-methylcytosine-specific restriction endonuclease McrA
MRKKPRPLHSSVKEALGYKDGTPTAKILASWRSRTQRICKPCWELKYCPYGPLVEDFPLLPTTRNEAEQHNEHLKACLDKDQLFNGQRLDPERRRWFESAIASFDINEHPESLPKVLLDASCRVFGHLCPVYFVAEPLTETKQRRSRTRLISREAMLKVVRRDGQICQDCNEPVRDDEVEFDHVIPFSRGGTTNPDNLRLVHRDCNRRKSDSLDEILSPNPIQHLFELQSKKA